MLERVCRAMEHANTLTYSVPANYRQPEANEIVMRHMNAFRDNTAAPSAATMRAFHAELRDLLDRPRA
jgi:hypothetical protein